MHDANRDDQIEFPLSGKVLSGRAYAIDARTVASDILQEHVIRRRRLQRAHMRGADLEQHPDNSSGSAPYLGDVFPGDVADLQ